MSSPKRITSLTLFDKLTIIKQVEDQLKIGARPSYIKIAEQFKTHRTTIGKIIQNKDVLKARSENENKSPTSLTSHSPYFLHFLLPEDREIKAILL